MKIFFFRECISVSKTETGKQFLIAHSYELYELENDLYNWIAELKQSKMRESIPIHSALVNGFFKDFDFPNIKTLLIHGNNNITDHSYYVFTLKEQF